MIGKFALASLAVALVLSVLSVVASIDNSRVDSWLDRARDAGNPEQVAEFLGEYKAALYAKNRVDGQYYTIWKYPASDMETYVSIIDGLTQRAEALAEQTAVMDSYQMGLINLEKDLDDIDARSFSAWFANGGYVLEIFHGLAWTALMVLGAIKMLNLYRY